MPTQQFIIETIAKFKDEATARMEELSKTVATYNAQMKFAALTHGEVATAIDTTSIAQARMVPVTSTFQRRLALLGGEAIALTSRFKMLGLIGIGTMAALYVSAPGVAEAFGMVGDEARATISVLGGPGAIEAGRTWSGILRDFRQFILGIPGAVGLTNFISNLVVQFGFLAVGLAAVRGAAAVLGYAFGTTLFGAATKFLGPIGLVLAALVIIDTLSKEFTGKGLIDWMKDLGDRLSKTYIFNLAYDTAETALKRVSGLITDIGEALKSTFKFTITIGLEVFAAAKAKFGELVEILKPGIGFLIRIDIAMFKIAEDKYNKLKSILKDIIVYIRYVATNKPELPGGYTPTGKREGEIVERQFGGPVFGRRPYIVGEHGAETFIPHTAGKIIPSGTGGNVTINATITINNPTSDLEIIRAIESGLLHSLKSMK